MRVWTARYESNIAPSIEKRARNELCRGDFGFGFMSRGERFNQRRYSELEHRSFVSHEGGAMIEEEVVACLCRAGQMRMLGSEVGHRTSWDTWCLGAGHSKRGREKRSEWLQQPANYA